MKRTIVKRFRDFLAAKGLNMSRQRVLILDAFLSPGTQMSVDDLYIKLRTRHVRLARSTVYRTLKLLAESGIARVLVVDGAGVRYERSHPAESESPAPMRQAGVDSGTPGKKGR